MKVENIRKTDLSKLRLAKKQDETSVTFKELMASRRSEIDLEKLNRLIEDIDEQGKILSESQTVEDLKRYKNMVKEFVNEAVKHGLKLQQSRGFNRGGRIRIHKTVQKVDDKLLELTDAVLGKEEKGLKILTIVGQIRGLLLDIYA